MSTERFDEQPFAHLSDGGSADTAVRREAELRGYAAGYAAGARRAERMLEERRSALEASARQQRELVATAEAQRSMRLDRVVAALEARLEPALDDARGALLEAAVELAETLLGRELSDGELSARGIAARVLARDDEQAVTRVRVHPAEVAPVAELLAGRRIEVVADPALAHGDAVAELPDGFLDARISTAVARVRRALAEDGAR
jgi:flagellar assembly protein FliH